MKRLLPGLILLFFSLPSFAQDNDVPTPQWRPVYHFTPEKYWTNDPNGLIYYNGKYQLYNQQNPFENKWGHMSWGHATSNDLVHWTHLPIAIPETIDKDTTWRFSGCVVEDKNNTSGFCKNGSCLVAIYTAHQLNRKLETQWIAYSNDGGMTYTNYDKNPVLDLQKQDFRDPNVRWNGQLKKWVMVVAMPAEHAVRFYSSPNLKEWTLLSEFGNDKEGFYEHVWECPSLIQLPVDGIESRTKWVLLVSSWGPAKGPFMQYFVGTFDGKTFTNDNPGTSYLTVDEGNTFYAAIPYNNQPQNKEILVGWMVPLKQPTYPWRGQFSIPRDLGLQTTSEGIRLTQKPSSVLESSLLKLPPKQKIVKSNITFDKEMSLSSAGSFNTNTNWIDATFTLGTANNFGFKLTQIDDETKATTVIYNKQTKELSIVPVNGEEIHSLKVKAEPHNGKINLQILLDKSSLEVFVNNGEKVLTTYIFPKADATRFSLFAEGGNVKLDTLKMYDLKQ